MELIRVDQVHLNETTASLLGDVSETARKVNELRPLSPDVIKEVQARLLGERVYSSNAIEGNTCDLRETIEILKAGHVGITPKREATEVINLGKAIEYTQNTLLDDENPHTPAAFLEVHEILLRGINDEWAGRYRECGVMIRGAKHQPPDHRFVPGMVSRVLEQMSNAKDIDLVLFATWAHWAIARIHPFMDGNGRLARLWQDLILFKGRLSCAIIRPGDRSDYLASLQEADEGDFNALTQLVAQRVASTLDQYVIAQREEREIDRWATELVGETSARAEEERKLAYLRWSRRMEELRYEFERCASKITHASEGIEIQFTSRPMIDQTTWESLRAGPGAGDTSFFKLVFRRDRRYLTYYFFFGKHFWSDADTDSDRAEPRVTLLISEQDHQEGGAKRLGDDDYDGPLSMREVFVIDDQLVRKRYDATRDVGVNDRGIEAMIVAREFVGEVLLLSLT